MSSGIISNVVDYLISTIGSLGYPGIFILMMIESTIFPLPSEIILIPAGVLISRGEMSWSFVLIASTLGSIIGALINYSFALFVGRRFAENILSKYGKFLFLDLNSLKNTETYFAKHGEMTTFVGRLLPVVRHLISLPAGFARMPLGRFCLYTGLGAFIYSLIIVYSGYIFGQALAQKSLALIYLILFLIVGIMLILYIIIHTRISRKNSQL